MFHSGSLPLVAMLFRMLSCSVYVLVVSAHAAILYAYCVACIKQKEI
jgi:hypothetical protein